MAFAELIIKLCPGLCSEMKPSNSDPFSSSIRSTVCANADNENSDIIPNAIK